jgi:hypothetical protein
VALAALLLAAAASAQKTDVVVLTNGDRVTGEIKSYAQGKLILDTSHSGVIKVKWSLIESITSSKDFEIELIDGKLVYGTLAPSDPPGLLAIVSRSDGRNVSFYEIFDMTPVFHHFWDRWEGSLDLGFNYTQSSQLVQFNLDAAATYKLRESQFVSSLSAFFSRQNDVTGASRASFSTRYERFLKDRWLLQGGVGLERNVQLGLDLRALAGVGAGRNVVQTNQTQLGVYAGVVATHEQPVDGESRAGAEGLLGARYTYFMYDFPNVTIGADLQVYPSFTVGGRVRLEASASVRREIISDFYLSLSIFDSFDSRDPSTLQSKNDWGPTVSIGWTF